MKLSLLLLILIVVFHPTAKADSDGYFCWSNNFLAYEFSFSVEPRRVHKLYVYRFDLGPDEQQKWLEIPEAQTQGIWCDENHVTLKLSSLYYRYSITSNRITLVSTENQNLPTRIDQSLPDLGWRKRSKDKPTLSKFELHGAPQKYEIHSRRTPTRDSCWDMSESKLVKIGNNGKKEILTTLYSGYALGECGSE